MHCVQQCQGHHSNLSLQTQSSLSPLFCQNTAGGCKWPQSSLKVCGLSYKDSNIGQRSSWRNYTFGTVSLKYFVLNLCESELFVHNFCKGKLLDILVQQAGRFLFLQNVWEKVSITSNKWLHIVQSCRVGHLFPKYHWKVGNLFSYF